MGFNLMKYSTIIYKGITMNDMNNMNFDFSWDDLSKNLQANAGAPKTFEKDTRFWTLSKDENGNGAALIRLLPDKDNKPFVKLFHYGIKKYNPTNPKKPLWFISDSPESIGLDCPVKEHYLALKAEGTTEADEESKKYKRQTKFIANIMVIKDPANPANDGKTFLFSFGTKMKDKFLSLMNPSDEEKAMGEEPKQLFNPLSGYDFKLKIKKQGEFSTYDGSEVAIKPTALFATKEEAVAFINTNTYALSEFLAPEHYSSYSELKERFDKFLGKQTSAESEKPVNKTAQKPVVVDDFELDLTNETPKASVVTVATKSTGSDDDSWLEDL
jgi:hypothetical protein